MTIKEYKQLLDNTTYYDKNQYSLSAYLKDIIDIANQMKYEEVLKRVKTFLDEYGIVRTTRMLDEQVSYIVVDAPISICEQIRNLKFHVLNQRECDFSEKILNLGR